MPIAPKLAFKEKSAKLLILLPLRTIYFRTFQCGTPCRKMTLKIGIVLYLTLNTKPNQIPRTFLWPFPLTFGLAYLPLNSATISCSSEVTLKAMQKTNALYGHGGVALFQPLSLLQKYFSVVPKYLGR